MDATQSEASDLDLYKELVEQTPMCIKLFDGTGNLVFINKGGREEHFLKDDQDISQWKWENTVTPEYRAKVLEAFKRGLQGESSQIEMEHTPEGATHRWCQGVISPIKDKDNKVKALLFYSVDMTDKKKADAELKKHLEAVSKLNKILVSREAENYKLKRQVKSLQEQLPEQDQA